MSSTGRRCTTQPFPFPFSDPHRPLLRKVMSLSWLVNLGLIIQSCRLWLLRSPPWEWSPVPSSPCCSRPCVALGGPPEGHPGWSGEPALSALWQSPRQHTDDMLINAIVYSISSRWKGSSRRPAITSASFPGPPPAQNSARPLSALTVDWANSQPIRDSDGEEGEFTTNSATQSLKMRSRREKKTNVTRLIYRSLQWCH